MGNSMMRLVNCLTVNEEQENVNEATAYPPGRDPDMCYPMRRPYGVALVINIQKFEGKTDEGLALDERHGSDHDVKRLKNLWEKLGFKVDTHEDLTADKIDTVFQEKAAEIDESQNSSCFVCCVMTHGDMGRIYGSDCKSLEIKYITDLFKKRKCPALAGKPKLFFIQACRAQQSADNCTPNADAKNVAAEDDYFGYDGKNDATFREQANPKEADFVLGYSTAPGCLSIRNSEKGTWYINALVDIFDKYYRHEDVLSMMTIINHEVSERCKENGYKQCPAPFVTITKKIFF